MPDGTGEKRAKGRRAPPGCFWRGNTLWSKLKIGGKELRRSLETDNVQLARARLAALKKEAIAYKRGDKRLTVSEVLDAWAPWLEREVASPRTVQSYGGCIKQLTPWLAGKHLDEITAQLVRDIVNGRRDQGVTNATIRRGLVALSSVMNFCIDQGYSEDNPVLPRLKRIKERRDPILLPSLEDIDKVVTRAGSHISGSMFPHLIVGAHVTGCRQEELGAATHSWLDKKARRLTVVGKGNKLRVIDLEPFDGYKIFDALPDGIANAPLFWHGNCQRYSNIAARFACLTLEIAANDPTFRRFRFHDLRHLHAVEWLRSGRSIYDLQQRLGHSSIKVTEVYLKYLTPDEERRVKGAGSAGLVPASPGGGTKRGTEGSGGQDASS